MLAVAILLGLQTLALADPLTAGSLWTNQRGSQLKITSVSGRSFRGTFTNNAAGFQCLGIPYPVTGTTFGVQITFTVNFVKCRTVTKWQGDFQGFGMSVQWVLQSKGQTQVGFDFFSRTN